MAVAHEKVGDRAGALRKTAAPREGEPPSPWPGGCCYQPPSRWRQGRARARLEPVLQAVRSHRPARPGIRTRPVPRTNKGC